MLDNPALHAYVCGNKSLLLPNPNPTCNPPLRPQSTQILFSGLRKTSAIIYEGGSSEDDYGADHGAKTKCRSGVAVRLVLRWDLRLGLGLGLGLELELVFMTCARFLLAGTHRYSATSTCCGVCISLPHRLVAAACWVPLHGSDENGIKDAVSHTPTL